VAAQTPLGGMYSASSSLSYSFNVGVLMPSSLHMSGTEIPDSTRLSASMIRLSEKRGFFNSVESFSRKNSISQHDGLSEESSSNCRVV
jgi:hypothetical protein